MRLDDPSELSPDDRFHEVVRILAAGVLRLRARAAIPQDPARENLPESTED